MTYHADGNVSDSTQRSIPAIPHYLQHNYWWAYVHPRAVRVFERQWLVNLILLGNYRRLTDAVLHSYGNQESANTLQIACAYGNLTPRLAKHMEAEGHLQVIDILPIQLNNLARKLPQDTQVKLHCMDSTALQFPNQHFDRALLFFLLHEQPKAVRTETLAEAIRVLRRGGTLTIIDYAGPSRFNPFRYFMIPILTLLKPFAQELWKEEVATWLPRDANIELVHKQRFFGGMYQMLILKVG